MVFPVIMFPAAILFGLTELLIPELARCHAAGQTERIHYLVKKSLRVALVYGLMTGGMLFLLSDSLCMGLYKSLDAAASMRAYALLVPMLYCDIITDAMTKGLGQQKICVRYNIFTSALDVLFLYLLLPHYGMQGYYLSFLVTHVINFLLSLRRLLLITVRRVNAASSLLSAAAMLIGIFAASHVGNLFLRISAYVLILGSLLVLCKMVRSDDLHWAKGLLYKK
jgi:stage V sporulation protein B